MSNAARLTLFRVSQFTHVLSKRAEENDLFRKAKLLLTLGAVLLAGGAAAICTGAVIFFLVVPAVVLISPVLLALSVLSLLYQKATRLWRRSVTIYNQNSSLVAEVGVWSVVSDRYRLP